MRPNADTFGHRLRDQRERHGVTLEAIAASTKINMALLAALERGDVSAWPHGLVRRAFVRAYATAIGVAPEPVLAEFVSLFPDHGTTVEPQWMPEAAGELRLTLALDTRSVWSAALNRVAIALLEVCAIVAFSLVTSAWVQRLDAWGICAAVALIYYPLARVFPARDRVFASIQSGFQRYRTLQQPVGAADLRDALHLVARPSAEASMESSEGLARAASPLRTASR